MLLICWLESALNAWWKNNQELLNEEHKLQKKFLKTAGVIVSALTLFYLKIIKVTCIFLGQNLKKQPVPICKFQSQNCR